ncbi:sn-glycerol-1-phosphate dehydrogenase [Microvirga lotononidis]|uniref:Glycerol dehydrogenase-like oxidoreductase n=1 Tax=Microvirga lotononidis TaxID=864069 RepID=I4YXW3_9HYPH|nr:sn-glycerol-1-phosphate dehydrogenase [Microvirga lotononidis]EIM28805.1 glycerol dehydrogenase-like oxidoreductase [Microvirga lotononidis]WQO25464.1 sn-glycerol-1-phosphate dehydrogenase [Microvirga lotononidis]
MAGQAQVLNEAVRRATTTRQVFVSSAALAFLPDAVRSAGGRVPMIIADRNTMEAAGRDALASLGQVGLADIEPILLEAVPRVKPHASLARGIADAIKAQGAIPVAVGSGVINDLTKYAAEIAGVPYVCVATAASMDGYAASGAALLDDGFKRTLDCAPPVSIVADLDVIARAPARMAGWGYGDLAGKIVAGADWKLADLLGEEPINHEPFALVQDNVRGWLSQPDAIGAGNPAAMGDLVNGLLVSGFAMQAHGNSRPASGAEHLISHVWEMERLTYEGEPAAHGACVGIGTVAILALYEWFLGQHIDENVVAQARGAASTPEAVEAEIEAAFTDRHIADSARTEMRVKMERAPRRAERLATLAADWPALREELRRYCIAPDEMETWLRAAGAAAHPGDLGLPLAQLAKEYRRARLIRRRFTILDLLDDLGWLDKGIAALMAGEGFWGRRSKGQGIAVSMP